MDRFEGTVIEILFSNDSNGYTVARIKIEDDEEVITGYMPGLTTGENIQVEGSWNIHEIYGRQFNVNNYKIVLPSTINGILSFLSSGVITGVGKKMAERIVERFGLKTLEVLQNSPEDLLEIEGIGRKKLVPIIESYNENMGVKNIIISLAPYGISPRICMKIYKKYGSSSIEVINSNPYRLIDDIVGVGFTTADEIAKKCGIEADAKFRVEQGVLHVLKRAVNQGHTFLPEEVLRAEASRLLEIEAGIVDECIFELALERRLVIEKYGSNNLMYLTVFYNAETEVCANIWRLNSQRFKDVLIDVESELEDIQEREGIHLAQAQRTAALSAFESGIMVLTGGPGTGKTTAINTIINLFNIAGKKVVLAAPTGRAAKRMTETTMKEAQTIHRLLEMAFDMEDRVIFAKSEDEPIDADVVIVDEASMIDIFLMDNLLRAIGKNTRLILVGDVDQLPSVGAGNVLNDIISSGVVNTIKLTEIFRQAKESNIIVNAHRINNGEDIVANQKNGDFYFINKEGDEDILKEIKTLVGGRLSEFYKVDPLKDIQVLSPMRKGAVGVASMNYELQQVLNPKKNDRLEVEFMKRIFRVGDKVMQIKNNYSKKWENENGNDSGEGIYNGDIGYVYHIDRQNKIIFIIFDEYKIFKYKYDELDEIEHCFCTTVHKSQGSEFPVVVIPMSWGPPMLLSRNLLYTAVTRAKKLVVVVGQKKYLDFMISNNKNNERYSNLSYKLSKGRIRDLFEVEEEF